MNSLVEQLYTRMQKEMGGTVPWFAMHPMHQGQFVQAINVILQLTSTTQAVYDNDTVDNEG